MQVEYVGPADRHVGSGRTHEVRAWWNSVHTDEGAVKRAACRAVREELGPERAHKAEVSHMDTGYYHAPNMDSLIRVRVLTEAEADERAELRSRVYLLCDVCDGPEPCEVRSVATEGPVRESGEQPCTELAVCYRCSLDLRGRSSVLHWLNSRGQISNVH